MSSIRSNTSEQKFALFSTIQRAFTSILILVLALLSSCASPFGVQHAQGNTSTNTTPTRIVQRIDQSYRPAEVWQLCADTSSSYKLSYIYKALGFAADDLEQAFRPNQDGIKGFIDIITANSFQDENTVLTFNIPSFQNDPYPPRPYTQPAQTNNPLADKAKADAALKQYTTDFNAYQATLVSRHQQLQTMARTDVKPQTDAIRRLRFTVENTATDLYGCAASASHRFSDLPGEHYLYFISDMQNNTLQEWSNNLSLKGVHVAILYRASDGLDAQETSNLDQQWISYFKSIGALDTTIYDPSESDLRGSTLFAS